MKLAVEEGEEDMVALLIVLQGLGKTGLRGGRRRAVLRV